MGAGHGQGQEAGSRRSPASSCGCTPQRASAPGFAFPEDGEWERELEEGFPYQETPDQEAAITAVKTDMQRPHPMDRLVCGDVGFGKTEVVRAGRLQGRARAANRP